MLDYRYQYTKITSVTLLDCFTIPCVLLWSIIIFRRSFKIEHYLSTFVCLCGLFLVAYSDELSNNNDSKVSNQLLGDILVLLGAFCYSVSNIFEEYIIKDDNSIYNFLQILSLFGFIISIIQGFLLEHDQLFSIEFDLIIILLILGYVLLMISYYILVPFMLQYSSAVFMNLSLLTSDVWSVLAGKLLFKIQLHWLYFISFFLTITGAICYQLTNHRYGNLQN